MFPTNGNEAGIEVPVQVPEMFSPEIDEKVVGWVGMTAEKFPVWSEVDVTSVKPSRPMLYSVAMSAWTAILSFG